MELDLIYDDADNVVELDGLRNEQSGAVEISVGSGSSTAAVNCSSMIPPPLADDEYNGRTLEFDETTPTLELRGRHGDITDSTKAGVLTVTLTKAPASGDFAKVVEYLNAATVAVTLKDSAGVDVVGETWPLAMTYVSGSKGRYRAILTDALTLDPGAKYTAIITAVSGTLNRRWERQVLCRKSL